MPCDTRNGVLTQGLCACMFFKFRVAWVLCRDALGASAMRLREGKQLKEGKLNALIGVAAISEANGVRTPSHHTSFVRALEEMGFERFLYAPVWRKSLAKRGSEVLGGGKEVKCRGKEKER